MLGGEEGEDEHLDFILNCMGMSYLIDHFRECEIDKDGFLKLTQSQIMMIMPQPDFKIGAVLKFMQSYIEFMTTYGFEVHPSLLSQDKPGPASLPKTSGTQRQEFKREPSSDRELGSAKVSKPVNEPQGLVSEDDHQHCSDSDDSPVFQRQRKYVLLKNFSEFDSDDEPLTVLKQRNSVAKESTTNSKSDVQTDKQSTNGIQSVLKNSTVNTVKRSPVMTPLNNSSSKSGKSPLSPKVQDSKSSDIYGVDENCNKQVENASAICSSSKSVGRVNETPAKSKPLVDRSKIGVKRKKAKRAATEIEELDLRELLDDNRLTQAIVKQYEDNPVLNNADRSSILSQVVSWLLNLTDYPTKENYDKLATKVCEIFHKEKKLLWYIPPFTVNAQQKNPKGKIPDRVKNVKEKLRSKGALPKRKQRVEPETPSSVVCSNEEKMAIEWLKRNHEPEEELRSYWRKCSKPRLQELLTVRSMTPLTYIQNWHDILKLPTSYKLVCDDFEILPQIDERFKVLEGKKNELLKNWEQFSKFVIKELESSSSGMNKKDKAHFQQLLSQATDDNARDYIILQILPILCKQKGRVKVGTRTIKPSTEECRTAFMLQVPVAAEFGECRRQRVEQYSNLKANVQPYIAVVSSEDYAVEEVYAVLHDTPWRMSSVLQAVDICFKMCFVVHCDYQPECAHLWLLIQQALYGFQMPQDLLVSTVIEFITKFETFSASNN